MQKTIKVNGTTINIFHQKHGYDYQDCFIYIGGNLKFGKGKLKRGKFEITRVDENCIELVTEFFRDIWRGKKSIDILSNGFIRYERLQEIMQ